MVQRIAPVLIALLAQFHASAGAQSSSQPADPIAGQWSSDAQFVMRDASPTPSYFWVGSVHAQISPTGRITMQSANGCSATGLLAPQGHSGKYKGAINLTRCVNPVMNRSYNIDANAIGGNLRLAASTKEIAGGKVKAVFDISTTLARR